MEVMREIHPERPVCGLGGRACSDGIFGRNEDGSYSQSTLFETDTIKLARVQLGPGGLLPEHRHDRCHVLVSLAHTACWTLPLTPVAVSCTLTPATPHGTPSTLRIP